jgi:hypothetical protein
VVINKPVDGFLPALVMRPELVDGETVEGVHLGYLVLFPHVGALILSPVLGSLCVVFLFISENYVREVIRKRMRKR